MCGAVLSPPPDSNHPRPQSRFFSNQGSPRPCFFRSFVFSPPQPAPISCSVFLRATNWPLSQFSFPRRTGSASGSPEKMGHPSQPFRGKGFNEKRTPPPPFSDQMPAPVGKPRQARAKTKGLFVPRSPPPAVNHYFRRGRFGFRFPFFKLQLQSTQVPPESLIDRPILPIKGGTACFLVRFFFFPGKIAPHPKPKMGARNSTSFWMRVEAESPPPLVHKTVESNKPFLGSTNGEYRSPLNCAKIRTTLIKPRGRKPARTQFPPEPPTDPKPGGTSTTKPPAKVFRSSLPGQKLPSNAPPPERAGPGPGPFAPAYKNRFWVQKKNLSGARPRVVFLNLVGYARNF